LSRKPTVEPHIKRMADLLRQGLTLTDLACPACASPLFRLKNGELWCEKCQKKVIVVKSEEDEAEATSSAVMEKLEATLLAKVQTVQNRIEHEERPEAMQKLNTVLSGLLENLERIRKAKRA
jgi:UPF0148 protein